VSRVVWRWAERDFGFRFRSGSGRKKNEYYQAADPNQFYTVPAGQRKLARDRIEALESAATPPPTPIIVASPWRYYERDWDWIATGEGVLLNFAGCLERKEIDRREDEGVARGMEFISVLLDRPEGVPLTAHLLKQIHIELLGAVYPFAGAWRTVALHKGDGPVKWPLPPGGIQQVIEVFERDVLSRSPFLSDDDEEVFGYVGEVMGELLAIHPFREGNGRTAFIAGNLLLMQNDLLPLDVYDRKSDETRYFGACEAARIHKNYLPLTEMISEWEAATLARWEAGREA